MCQSLDAKPTPTPPPPMCAAWNSNECTQVNTALGLIGTDPKEFIAKLFAVLLSISGGIALLMIIYSGYQLMISRGNPELVKAARERITSAIVGLLFMIFSLVILQIIGVDILHIPGIGR
jgi:hypothetical protein